jgi:hypothetical protein
MVEILPERFTVGWVDSESSAYLVEPEVNQTPSEVIEALQGYLADPELPEWCEFSVIPTTNFHLMEPDEARRARREELQAIDLRQRSRAAFERVMDALYDALYIATVTTVYKNATDAQLEQITLQRSQEQEDELERLMDHAINRIGSQAINELAAHARRALRLDELEGT